MTRVPAFNERALPVATVKHHNIRRRQIDAQPSRSCGQQKDKLLTPRLVVLVYSNDTFIVGRTPVNTTVFCTAVNENADKTGSEPLTYYNLGTGNNLPVCPTPCSSG